MKRFEGLVAAMTAAAGEHADQVISGCAKVRVLLELGAITEDQAIQAIEMAARKETSNEDMRALARTHLSLGKGVASA